MNVEIIHLSERISRLEKKNSSQQRIIFLLAGLFVVLASAGFREGTPKVIEAEKFILRDENGRVKSAWYSENNENIIQSRLEFYTRRGDTSVMLGYKRNFNNPFLLMKEKILGGEFELNLRPGRINLSASNPESEGGDGYGLSLVNIPNPSFEMTHGMEAFQLHLRDTGLVVGRYGTNPKIFVESNEEEIIHLEQNLLRKGK